MCVFVDQSRVAPHQGCKGEQSLDISNINNGGYSGITLSNGNRSSLVVKRSSAMRENIMTHVFRLVDLSIGAVGSDAEL